MGTLIQFEVILVGGIEPVEYDLKQVHDQGYARYLYLDEMHETDELLVGQQIEFTIVDDIMKDTDENVVGFCVPDYLVGAFIVNYPEMTILRQ